MKKIEKQNKKIKSKELKKILSGILFAIVFLISLLTANADLIALQGTVDNPTATDIRITIYDSPTGGTLIYDSGTDFNNAIHNGRYAILH